MSYVGLLRPDRGRGSGLLLRRGVSGVGWGYWQGEGCRGAPWVDEVMLCEAW